MGPDNLEFTVEEDLAGTRLDKAVSLLADGFSRSRLQALIEARQLTLNDRIFTDSSYKLKTGDKICIRVSAPEQAKPRPEKIPLDIVYEDADLLVLNKQPGLVVHPGAGNPHGTLVNALLHHCGDSLSGIGGVRRPGIVHRLDKDTSGLMLVAKHDAVHQGLAAQLESRTLSRRYLALTFKVPVPLAGRIDKAIGRHARNRLKMAVYRNKGKQAVTDYKTLEKIKDLAALVECRLQTGRTHQIRVHMESIGCPLIGDPLYRAPENAIKSALNKCAAPENVREKVLGMTRQALHAAGLEFAHPASGKSMTFTADPPEDFNNLLKSLRKL